MTVHYKMAANMILSDPLMDICNIFYFSTPSAYPFSDAGLTAMLDHVYGPLANYLPTTLQGDTIGLYTWEGPEDGVWWDPTVGEKGAPKKNPPWSVVTLFEWGFQGDGVGELLPPSVAGVIYAHSPTKHVIARKFLGPLLESTQDKGMLTQAAFDALIASSQGWSILTNDSGVGSGTTEVWGAKHGFNPLRGFVADRVLGTNRRRKPGRGS